MSICHSYQKEPPFGDPFVVISTDLIVAENAAENMTVPRKADRAYRLDYKATAATMYDCTATATLSALPITTKRKVSQKGSSEIFISQDKLLHLQKAKSVHQEKSHLHNKKSHICGSIWGLFLDIFGYLIVYQIVTMLYPTSTGYLRKKGKQISYECIYQHIRGNERLEEYCRHKMKV